MGRSPAEVAADETSSPARRGRGGSVDPVRRTGPRLIGLVVAVGVLAAAACASLMIGSRAIDTATVWEAVTAFDGGNAEHVLVRELRLPRTVIGVVVGAALAVCGGLIQAFTRNPLADPGILGVNAGASLMVTFAVGVLGLQDPAGYVAFAMLGAFALTIVVYALGSVGRGGPTRLKLTLAGVALGAACSGVTSALVLENETTMQAIRFWGVGSIGGRSLAEVARAMPLIVAGLVLAMMCARALNVLALGDELSHTLGARPQLTRVAVVIAITVLAGTSVAAAGPIAFVGIMIPHAVRWFTGPDQRWILAYSMALGGAFLLVADVLGRLVLPSGELRVGIVTGLLGAPVLIALVRRHRAAAL
ncbi:FecCD family ABC transporter permease [Microbacterium sp. TNHR37B]|uniref:FecCD family ABC transporter permease n=1 Tax=Microbacterium sp. TNHR37B TaxID=1775956 RepID=UPI0007B1CF2C|nr:iron chelate uptake ABC transporter family permease subunit [Microbacterium sp. TNHR37B]KZE90561.1 putative siderophore transport system permease protein YfiZ [Microbacterium sp. TNHR37B]